MQAGACILVVGAKIGSNPPPIPSPPKNILFVVPFDSLFVSHRAVHRLQIDRLFLPHPYAAFGRGPSATWETAIQPDTWDAVSGAGDTVSATGEAGRPWGFRIAISYSGMYFGFWNNLINLRKTYINKSICN